MSSTCHTSIIIKGCGSIEIPAKEGGGKGQVGKEQKKQSLYAHTAWS
jgi:hypothetical protein